MDTPGRRRHGGHPFAVEDTSVQLTWSRLGPGPVQVRGADTTVDIMADGGPGGLVVEGLPPGRPSTSCSPVRVCPGRLGVRTDTLDRLPGEELFRLATIGDLHFGRPVRLPFDRPRRGPTGRAPSGALRLGRGRRARPGGRAAAGGQGRHHRSGHSWEGNVFGRLVAGPVARGCRSTSSPATTTSTRDGRSSRPSRCLLGLGLRPVAGVEAVDLPGLRLVLVDSTRPGDNHGSVAHRLARRWTPCGIAGGVLIADAPPTAAPSCTEGWPWGVPRHESMRYLDAVAPSIPTRS